jgi:ATP-dependent helicase/nuclease subunit A
MSSSPKLDLTPSQRDAVNVDATLLVVRAGAGSGKTRVLVDRYLRLVLGENGLSPKAILAATFTEKAASEMKERVARELTRAGRSDLVAELNAAPISTLHGFCSRLITPHVLALGLDPAYRILEPHDATLLQEEVLTGLFTRWRKLWPDRLQNIISDLHWSADFKIRSGRPPSSRGFSRQFLELVEAVRCAGQSDNAPFATLPESGVELQRNVRMMINQLHDKLEAMGNKAPAAQMNAHLACSCLDRYLNLNDPCHAEIPRIVNDLIGMSLKGKSDLGPILKSLKVDLCPQIMDQFHRPRYNALSDSLNALFEEFLKSYQAEKMRLGVADFLDLEEKALEILSWDDQPRPVQVVLIDEAQDLNPVQWRLITHLTGQAPLFAVGDAQQSLYGFRHAEVELYRNLVTAAEEKGGRVILMGENFRSRNAVIGAVNSLFEGLWVGDNPNSFLRLEAHYPYPHQVDDHPELLLAEGSDREKAREAEAELLVHRLAELVRGGQFVVHEETMVDGYQAILPRAPRWSDVLVLVRTSNAFEPLERAFRELEVPYLIQAGRGFWDTLEIADLMALLRCLEDPGDSFSLACVLKSPAVGFSDDDLIELRLELSEPDQGDTEWRVRPLYLRLKTLADQSNSLANLNHRVAAFLDLFERLYQLKDRIPLRHLLDMWISETGLELLWSGQRNGRLKINNLRKFLRLCDGQAGQSLARLRAVFEEIRLREAHEGEAPSQLVGSGTVRVMTVHSAKGLEAPLVAIFDMNHKLPNFTGAFAYELNRGAAFTLQDYQSEDETFKATPYREIYQNKTQHQSEESQRVLYVAMTRAREKLILSASCSMGKNETRQTNGWFKLFLSRYNLNPDQLFDPTVIPSGYFQVGDDQGVPMQYRLLRAQDQQPLPDMSFEVALPAVSPPAGFPVTPGPGVEPVPIVAYLKERGKFPVDFQVADDGSLLSDEETEGGIALGRWVHHLLEILPWNLSKSDWQECARKEAKILFRREATQAEITEALRLTANFLRSPLADRARAANRVLREFPFLFEAQGVLLKGKLDLAFEDASGWTLVDYKSDRRLSDERFAAYQAQLQLYAQGWKALTGQAAVQTLLFFLDEAKEVAVKDSLPSP